MEEIIYENEKLIYSIASRYKAYYSIEDLFQVGSIGIIKAYKKYDRNANTKFSSFAYKYILGEIIEYIRKDRNIVVSDEVFSIYKKYIKVKDLLFSKLEREASVSEISEFMGLDETSLIKIIESVAFTKTMEDDNEYYRDERENIDNKILLSEEISYLDTFSKSLIDYRYYQGYTQSETADILGVTQVKVSRQEKLILSKMRSSIKNETA